MTKAPTVKRYIIDNRNNTVAEYLEHALVDADTFSFVSAYFTIYGYDLLAEILDRLGNVRFLFGDPVSVEELDPGADDPKSFEFTERRLEPTQILKQKALAKRCAEWFRKDTVAVRSTSQSNFLHGKMYITEGKTHSAVVGSSNFTKRGLGGSNQSNLEINLTTEDTDTVEELLEWFNQLWCDKHRTEDVKHQVLNTLERVGKDYAPQDVYYKTLFELFRRDIEVRLTGEDAATVTGFQDSQVWNTLYEFQKDGAKSTITKLREHNGCILADSVGLGKTYTALAVIKYFELRNERVLVLCPRKLFENWQLYPAIYNHRQNPFSEDRFGYTVLAHTDLSRDSGDSGGVDLAKFNWGNYDLVVIDESHNFRNDSGKRYRRLLEEVIKAGAKTKVLMLSATPVNTSLTDLRNQIYLMTEGREQFFRKSLKVGSIRNTMAVAQRQFKEWEQKNQQRNGPRDKNALLEQLGPVFFQLLNGVSISRSRRHIKQFYAREMDRVGQFPKRLAPENIYPETDRLGELSYKKLADRIGKFMLAVYQPSEYVIEPTRLADLESRRKEQNFNQSDSERFLIGMIRVNFLKRLESSVCSLRLTLERTIGKINNLLEKIDSYEQISGIRGEILQNVDLLPDNDREDEDFLVNRGINPYNLRELDLPRWQVDLEQDKVTLSTVLTQLIAITPERDGKLQQIKKDIRNKMTNPTQNQDDRLNRKLLVFTTFKDTAVYLYNNLRELASELDIGIAMVSGDMTMTTAGENKFNSILTNFAPLARQRSDDDANADIDLLIATDCISEGQNLQDCDTVLNYDIHWNPVRLIQRFGRIDRIGSKNESVQMVNYWPTKNMETYLRLQNRVQARMALADLAASGDENPFTEADAQAELNHRDAQLIKLKNQILDLEDLEDGPSMGDFTLDHFFTQLLHYLESKKDMLKSMPSGVYAVTVSSAEAMPGVIFFLRQSNAGDGNEYQRLASPVHPFHFVYIQDNGNIRYGCSNAQQTLTAFEAAAAGKTKPIVELCNRFDQETVHGENMDLYSEMLNNVIAHILQTHGQEQKKGLGLQGEVDFKLPSVLEAPHTADDFELITWLVVKESNDTA